MINLRKQLFIFSKQNKKLKKELTVIIENINTSIENSSKELNKKDLFSNSDIYKLSNTVQMKEKELQSRKISLNLHKKQLDVIESKSNDKKSLEKY